MGEAVLAKLLDLLEVGVGQLDRRVQVGQRRVVVSQRLPRYRPVDP